MVAARPVTFVDLTQPSGTESVWGMDSPTLGRMSNVNLRKPESPAKSAPAAMSGLGVEIRPLEIRKAAHVAPLNIKKIRRRGFMNGVEAVQLHLPPSPLPPVRSPLGVSQVTTPPSQTSLTFNLPPATPTPQTALTFTAEWDLTQRTFVFTPFETAFSSPPMVFTPRSAGSTYSPIPDDVKSIITVAGSRPGSPAVIAFAPEEHTIVRHALSIQVPAIDVTDVEVVPPSPSSSVDTPLSEIFDERPCLSHSRKSSQTTLSPVSPVDALSSKVGSSSSSLAKQMNLHVLEEELNRSMHVSERKDKNVIDSKVYDELDEDVLMAPMAAFEQMFWDSTDNAEPEPISREDEDEMQTAQTAQEAPVVASDGVVIIPADDETNEPHITPATVPRNASWESVRSSGPNTWFTFPNGAFPTIKYPSKTRRKRKFSEDLVVGLSSVIR